MNFLFHMLLSGADEQLLVGNFMGDFVKGPLLERFEPRIRQGVILHRQIDSYAERHPLYRHSRQRLAAEYGRYRGVMVDIFFDYYLANDWDAWCDESFSDYLTRTHAVVERHHPALPEALQRVAPIIFEELLPSYATVAGIGSALSRLSRRLTRANPLHGGERELIRLHDELRYDFRAFAPEAFRFAGEVIDFMAPTLFPPQGD
jgi:acyl carrier protein phosphodiesterase